MKTKEFIKKVEELGYKVEKMHNIHHILTHILIYVSEYKTPIYVGTNQKNKINTDNLIVPDELFDLCVEYARTPIEEREEPKKYYLRLPNYLYESSSYLNYNAIDKTYCFYGGNEFGELQTKFTQEEIDNLPNQDFIKTLIKEEVYE